MTRLGSADLDWMIDRWVAETPGVMHAVLVAADGLPLAASRGLHGDQVDRTAATAGSLLAIAASLGRDYGAGMPEILTFRATHVHFLFMTVSDLAGLAVLVERRGNLGIIGHHMQRLVTAVGPRLDPGPRPTPPFRTTS